jgi:endoglucanase
LFCTALLLSFIIPQLTTASPTLQAVTNLALGKTASASSIEGAGFEAAKAVDGSGTTRWASAEGSDPQWIMVDLGASASLSRVVLTWEAAYAKSYRVEVSANASTWSPVYSTTAGDGNTDDLTIASSGRYVRVYGTQRGTPYGYSLFELAVYGTATKPPTATTIPPTATRVPPTATGVPPLATVTPVGAGNIARGKAATASSIEAAGLEAGKAVDGSGTTRWASAYSDPQWLRIDLNATYAINRVVLKWEVAYGRAYRVEVSNDGSSWTPIYSTTTGDGATDDLAVSGTGRYVRIYGTARATQWGYSLWEVEVYAGSGPQPTTIPPTTAPPTTVPPTTVPPTIQPTVTPPPPVGTTPAAINGQLRVCGTQLCNQYGKPIQLRGMSTHGLQWYGWGSCITTSSLDALANDWKADILRISLYVQEGGYETDPAGFKTQVDRIIDEASKRGMYALIDWHMLDPGDPMYNLDRAKEYFTYMAQKHGGRTNVLYEIANEPSGVSWATIKSYAEQIIPVIRRYDPDGIVIVGTRDWSSFGISGDGNPEEVINNQVNATNIMYTFHFYAASHLSEYLAALDRASDRIPVFVTEWGSQEYTGDGPNNFTSTQAYIDLMARKKISWTSWNYSDDERSGAAFKPGTCAAGGPWSGASLKPAGTWVRDKILNPADNFPTN